LPILPTGSWDYLIKRYKPKEESKEYSTKKLFIPETGRFIPVDEDADPRRGVMSRFDANLIVPTPMDHVADGLSNKAILEFMTTMREKGLIGPILAPNEALKDKIVRAPMDEGVSQEDWEIAG
jgi:hypothetical protein